jgi:TldD protein
MTDFAFAALGKDAPALPVYADEEGVLAPTWSRLRTACGGLYEPAVKPQGVSRMEPGGNARAYMFSDDPLIRKRNPRFCPAKDRL